MARRKKTPLYRHGDVLVAPVASLPEGAKRRPQTILAHGEVTGHTHRLADPAAGALYEHRGSLFLDVTAPAATLIHEEHKPIELPRGTYRVWRQREYSPEAIRTIQD